MYDMDSSCRRDIVNAWMQGIINNNQNISSSDNPCLECHISKKRPSRDDGLHFSTHPLKRPKLFSVMESIEHPRRAERLRGRRDRNERERVENDNVPASGVAPVEQPASALISNAEVVPAALLSTSNSTASPYAIAINRSASVTELTLATTLSHPSLSTASRSTRTSPRTSPSRNRPASPSSQGGRSRSPAKTVRDLNSARPATKLVQIGHPNKALPEHTQKLHMALLRARRRKGLLPACVREEIRPYLTSSIIDPEDDDGLFGSFANDAGNREAELSRLYGILDIRESAQSCFERDKPEASWGEEVVRPLLDLALRRLFDQLPVKVVAENVTAYNAYSSKFCSLRLDNSTTARIHPPSLVPTSATLSALPFSAKRVDYALYINPSPSQVSLIQRRLDKISQTMPPPSMLSPENTIASINQSDAGYLRLMPHVASIELKKTQSNIDPLVQLAIWNSAGLARIRELRTSTGDSTWARDMLPVPSLVIMGHRWEIYYTYLQEGDEYDGLEDEREPTRIIRGGLAFGSTADVIGIYEILRGLQGIAKYMAEEYWPWFEREILGG